MSSIQTIRGDQAAERGGGRGRLGTFQDFQPGTEADGLLWSGLGNLTGEAQTEPCSGKRGGGGDPRGGRSGAPR
jgi:hypothetical protein